MNHRYSGLKEGQGISHKMCWRRVKEFHTKCELLHWWVEQRVPPAEGKHQNGPPSQRIRVLLYKGSDKTVLLYKGSDKTALLYKGSDKTVLLYKGSDKTVLLYKGSELYLQSQKTASPYTKGTFGLNLRVWLVSTWNGINKFFSQNFKIDKNFFFWFLVCMFLYTV